MKQISENRLRKLAGLKPLMEEDIEPTKSLQNYSGKSLQNYSETDQSNQEFINLAKEIQQQTNIELKELIKIIQLLSASGTSDREEKGFSIPDDMKRRIERRKQLYYRYDDDEDEKQTFLPSIDKKTVLGIIRAAENIYYFDQEYLGDDIINVLEYNKDLPLYHIEELFYIMANCKIDYRETREAWDVFNKNRNLFNSEDPLDHFIEIYGDSIVSKIEFEHYIQLIEFATKNNIDIIEVVNLINWAVKNSIVRE